MSVNRFGSYIRVGSGLVFSKALQVPSTVLKEELADLSIQLSELACRDVKKVDRILTARIATSYRRNEWYMGETIMSDHLVAAQSALLEVAKHKRRSSYI